jgi:hypothetical protein
VHLLVALFERWAERRGRAALLRNSNLTHAKAEGVHRDKHTEKERGRGGHEERVEEVERKGGNCGKMDPNAILSCERHILVSYWRVSV